VYKVDPTNDPQQQGSSRGIRCATTEWEHWSGRRSVIEDDGRTEECSIGYLPAQAVGFARTECVPKKYNSRSDLAVAAVVEQKISQTRPMPLRQPRDYRSSAENVVGSFPYWFITFRITEPTDSSAHAATTPQNAVSPPLVNQPVESVLSDLWTIVPRRRQIHQQVKYPT